MINEEELIRLISTNDYMVKRPNAEITGLGMFTADILHYIAQCTKVDKIQGKPSYNINEIQKQAEKQMKFDI